MFEAILGEVLAIFLGDFVKDIDEVKANLKLQLWDGDVSLEGLDIREDALLRAGLDAPVAGHVHSLRVHIPWKRPTDPCDVVADGVCAVARIGASVAGTAPASLSAHAAARRRAMLALHDERMRATSRAEAQEEEAARAMAIARRALARLRLRATRLHVRVETPSGAAVGVRLDSLVVTSEESGPRASLEGLSMYFSPRGSPLAPIAGRREDLFAFMLGQRPAPGADLPALRPVSAKAVVSIPQQSGTRGADPLDIALEAREVRLELTEADCDAVLEVADRAVQCLTEPRPSPVRTASYSVPRPEHSARDDPRAWFVYAAKCAMEYVRRRKRACSASRASARRRDRARYVALYRSILACKSGKGSRSERKELEEIEAEYEYDEVVLFRQMALEALLSARRQKLDRSTSRKGFGLLSPAPDRPAQDSPAGLKRSAAEEGMMSFIDSARQALKSSQETFEAEANGAKKFFGKLAAFGKKMQGADSLPNRRANETEKRAEDSPKIASSGTATPAPALDDADDIIEAFERRARQEATVEEDDDQISCLRVTATIGTIDIAVGRALRSRISGVRVAHSSSALVVGGTKRTEVSVVELSVSEQGDDAGCILSTAQGEGAPKSVFLNLEITQNSSLVVSAVRAEVEPLSLSLDNAALERIEAALKSALDPQRIASLVSAASHWREGPLAALASEEPGKPTSFEDMSLTSFAAENEQTGDVETIARSTVVSVCLSPLAIGFDPAPLELHLRSSNVAPVIDIVAALSKRKLPRLSPPSRFPRQSFSVPGLKLFWEGSEATLEVGKVDVTLCDHDVQVEVDSVLATTLNSKVALCVDGGVSLRSNTLDSRIAASIKGIRADVFSAGLIRRETVGTLSSVELARDTAGDVSVMLSPLEVTLDATRIAYLQDAVAKCTGLTIPSIGGSTRDLSHGTCKITAPCVEAETLPKIPAVAKGINDLFERLRGDSFRADVLLDQWRCSVSLRDAVKAPSFYSPPQLEVSAASAQKTPHLVVTKVALITLTRMAAVKTEEDTIAFCNVANVAIEVGRVAIEGAEPELVGVVNPNKRQQISLLPCFAAVLRPHDGKHEWATPCLRLAMQTPLLVQCGDVSLVLTRHVGRSVMISPPLLVESFLLVECCAKFVWASGDEEMHTIKASSSMCLYRPHVQHVLVRVQDGEWSSPIPIAGRARHQYGTRQKLGSLRVRTAPGRLELSCSWWLCNRTGEDVVVRDQSDAKNPIVLQPYRPFIPYSGNGHVQVRLPQARDQSWSDLLLIRAIGPRGIVLRCGSNCIAVRTDLQVGRHGRSHVVTLSPRVVARNSSCRRILLRIPSDRASEVAVDQGSAVPLPCTAGECVACLSVDGGSTWSLPFPYDVSEGFHVRLHPAGSAPVVVPVTVADANSTNHVVFGEDEGQAPYIVQNCTAAPVRICQFGAEQYEQVVEPGYQAHFCWDALCIGKRLSVDGAVVDVTRPGYVGATLPSDGVVVQVACFVRAPRRVDDPWMVAVTRVQRLSIADALAQSADVWQVAEPRKSMCKDVLFIFQMRLMDIGVALIDDGKTVFQIQLCEPVLLYDCSVADFHVSLVLHLGSVQLGHLRVSIDGAVLDSIAGLVEAVLQAKNAVSSTPKEARPRQAAPRASQGLDRGKKSKTLEVTPVSQALYVESLSVSSLPITFSYSPPSKAGPLKKLVGRVPLWLVGTIKEVDIAVEPFGIREEHLVQGTDALLSRVRDHYTQNIVKHVLRVAMACDVTLTRSLARFVSLFL
eukprot:m51a1_g2376 hypothetical protein (1750) ;mRNA; r:677263-685290